MLGLSLSMWLIASPPLATPPPAPRPSKAQRLLIGSGVAYGLGSAIQWATAGGSGMLADARPGGNSGVTLGMTLSSLGMVQGIALAGIGSRELAKDSYGHDSRAGARGGWTRAGARACGTRSSASSTR